MKPTSSSDLTVTTEPHQKGLPWEERPPYREGTPTPSQPLSVSSSCDLGWAGPPPGLPQLHSVEKIMNGLLLSWVFCKNLVR